MGLEEKFRALAEGLEAEITDRPMDSTKKYVAERIRSILAEEKTDPSVMPDGVPVVDNFSPFLTLASEWRASARAGINGTIYNRCADALEEAVRKLRTEALRAAGNEFAPPAPFPPQLRAVEVFSRQNDGLREPDGTMLNVDIRIIQFLGATGGYAFVKGIDGTNVPFSQVVGLLFQVATEMAVSNMGGGPDGS